MRLPVTFLSAALTVLHFPSPFQAAHAGPGNQTGPTTTAEDADGARERVDHLIRSASRPISDGFASIEWVVDTSDLIVTARIVDVESRLGPAPESTLKAAAGIDARWLDGDAERLAAVCDLYQSGDRMLFCWRFEPGERQWTLYDYFPLLPADDPRCRDGNDFYRKPADDLDSTSKMYGGDGTGMQASGSWRWTMPAT